MISEKLNNIRGYCQGLVIKINFPLVPVLLHKPPKMFLYTQIKPRD